MDADRMRLPRTPSLVRDGYVTCDSVHVPDSMRTALHRLCNAGSSGLSYNSERRGIVFDSSMFSANEWACAFPQDCVQSIETYLGKNAVLLRTGLHTQSTVSSAYILQGNLYLAQGKIQQAVSSFRLSIKGDDR